MSERMLHEPSGHLFRSEVGGRSVVCVCRQTRIGKEVHYTDSWKRLVEHLCMLPENVSPSNRRVFFEQLTFDLHAEGFLVEGSDIEFSCTSCSALDRGTFLLECVRQGILPQSDIRRRDFLI